MEEPSNARNYRFAEMLSDQEAIRGAISVNDEYVGARSEIFLEPIQITVDYRTGVVLPGLPYPAKFLDFGYSAGDPQTEIAAGRTYLWRLTWKRGRETHPPIR